MSADTAPAAMPGEAEPNDAPCYLSASEASAWASGFNAAHQALAPILAEKERELREARSRLRWNIEDDGRLVRICEGLHEKSEDCEFDTYVPEARALAAEAALAAERERASGLLDANKRASEILRGRGYPGWGVAKDILNEAIASASRCDRS